MNIIFGTKKIIWVIIFKLFVFIYLSAAQTDTRLISPRGLGGIERHILKNPLEGGNIDKLEINSLNAHQIQGLKNIISDGISIIEFTENAKFSRPLRSKKNEIVYVSFGLLGAVGTIVDVDGAKIGVGESSVVNGYANVMVSAFGDDWRATPLSVPFRKYNGNRLAALPVLTIRLIPEEGKFDLYANSQLLVEGVDYSSDSENRQIRIIAGASGASLMGLVQSDTNPLYIDVNENGIDDDFEIAHGGALAKKNSTRQDLKMLHSEWRKAERFVPPPPLFVARPRADN